MNFRFRIFSASVYAVKVFVLPILNQIFRLQSKFGLPFKQRKAATVSTLFHTLKLLHVPENTLIRPADKHSKETKIETQKA